MSAILSADDLNDFISPGVACIKPVETLPLQKPSTVNSYEVTTEDKVAPDAPPAQISLTDCLACSGCVTSAEAILVSLQSHAEVLNALDSHLTISPEQLRQYCQDAAAGNNLLKPTDERRIFVASVSPQVRASLAATYGVTEGEAGWMIEQLFSGEHGLRGGGQHGNRFAWVLDTNAMREIGLVMGVEEATTCTSGDDTNTPKKPVLTSACPGWICYAEKTHPHVLPHLSRLKSPQALTGTIVKTVLSQRLGVKPHQIWHLAVMPCFDKKLEASRQELTDAFWRTTPEAENQTAPVRDVDCVITAREVLMLADSRGISFPSLPRQPLAPGDSIPFPDRDLHDFLFSRQNSHKNRPTQKPDAGSSGGFLYHILCTQQKLYSGSQIRTERGRNADVVDYTIVRDNEVLFRAARYYGFRNIQNLVRKLKPQKKSRLPGGKAIGARKPLADKSTAADYAYVEVMACPGGCTNGGGQIKVGDLGELQVIERAAATQKEWLDLVDEAYYSMDDEDGVNNDENEAEADEADRDTINGVSTQLVKKILARWVDLTGIELEKLIYTSFRQVESDVGKVGAGATERVAEIAGKIGGGW